jgi:hypothetical protein
MCCTQENVRGSSGAVNLQDLSKSEGDSKLTTTKLSVPAIGMAIGADGVLRAK